jgi:aspartate ammonia-lyase
LRLVAPLPAPLKNPPDPLQARTRSLVTAVVSRREHDLLGDRGVPADAYRGVRTLRAITGLSLVTAANLVEATQDRGAFVHMSGVLKRIAVKLSKSCNDLRLLSSGPRAGLGEISLPPVQAGSSIMPGKANPVVPEVVNQVAFEVIGNDVTITMAAEAGQLQLNVFEPVILHSLSESITHLRAACLTLAERCVDGMGSP